LKILAKCRFGGFFFGLHSRRNMLSKPTALCHKPAACQRRFALQNAFKKQNL